MANMFIYNTNVSEFIGRETCARTSYDIRLIELKYGIVDDTLG